MSRMLAHTFTQEYIKTYILHICTHYTPACNLHISHACTHTNMHTRHVTYVHTHMHTHALTGAATGPTLSCSTRSMRYLHRGLMSLRISAVMMSMPLDSCVTMQVCRSSGGTQGPGPSGLWQPEASVSPLPSLLYPPTRLPLVPRRLTWFSWQGPWQYSVRVSRVWMTRPTLSSLM